MESVLKTIGQLIYTDGKHKGFLVSWKLVSPLCKKWSRNRDPDMDRVSEMLAFHIGGGYIPKVVHLAEIPGEGLVSYDGNHRREVFNRVLADDPQADVAFVVDVLFGATQADVHEAFVNLNKAVSVPDVYMDELNDSAVKQEILELVRSYETRFPDFRSTSDRCRSPHFNRDKFIDNVYAIYKSFNGALPVAEIARLLEELNAEYAAGRMCKSPHSSYPDKVIGKCTKNNFWLFIDRTIPVQHVALLHNRRPAA